MREEQGFAGRFLPLLEPHGLLLLTLLVFTDLVFIALHLVREWTPWVSYWMFKITEDRTYAEIYQYVKCLWVGLMLFLLFVRTRQVGHLAWSLVFAYILVDDSMQYHEEAGEWIAQTLHVSGFGSMRGQDFGELLAHAAVGIPLLGLVGLAFLRGSAAARNATIDLLLLLVLLAGFGAAGDLLHMAVSETPLRLAAALLEDGGEMIAISCATAYVFSLFLRAGEMRPWLWQTLLGRRAD